MIDALLGLVHQAVASPWVYAALFLLAALDGFFPVVPGETAIVVASVFTGTGDTGVLFIIGAAALGAFAGDHTSYLLGRAASGPVTRRMRKGTRRRAGFDRVDKAFADRGAAVLVASRLIPGVRTGTTMTMGVTGYPLRLFSRYDALAATLWASYWALLGYLGDAAFHDEPLKGTALALGLAAAAAAVIEGQRRVRRRRRGSRPTKRSCH
ncbi:DedA family protein [Saccharomonospora saliphila]|uniref:DedA family protein n=1 Tax=Saccharomonospora saliphila TaxID=369829 RepID=UPI00035DF652|nr:VTT domain-containing protein [Saccharomonospora saliphila]